MKTKDIMLDRNEKKRAVFVCLSVSFLHLMTFSPPKTNLESLSAGHRRCVMHRSSISVLLLSQRAGTHSDGFAQRGANHFPRTLLVASKTKEPLGTELGLWVTHEKQSGWFWHGYLKETIQHKIVNHLITSCCSKPKCLFFCGKQKNMFSRTFMNGFYYMASMLYLKCFEVCFLYKSTLPVSSAHLQTDIKN